MKKFRKPPTGLVILFGLILAINFYTFFGGRGILRLRKQHQDLNDIKASATSIQKENQRLKSEVQLLQRDKRYIEKMARDELGLIREGEILYKKKGKSLPPPPYHEREQFKD